MHQLTDPDELDTALESPHPILIFKHSPTCGVSAQANDEILGLLQGPPLAAQVWRIPVQAGRAASNAVATRFGIRHESPQVILVDRGIVLWHASHFRVTSDAIRSALARHLPNPTS
jgi:bacillithiol system protein YtxJ